MILSTEARLVTVAPLLIVIAPLGIITASLNVTAALKVPPELKVSVILVPTTRTEVWVPPGVSSFASKSMLLQPADETANANAKTVRRKVLKLRMAPQ